MKTKTDLMHHQLQQQQKIIDLLQRDVEELKCARNNNKKHFALHALHSPAIPDELIEKLEGLIGTVGELLELSEGKLYEMSLGNAEITALDEVLTAHGLERQN
ncbi:MAG TPA: hypothetical protein VFM02_04495 [Candidatus Paceibacterota bacterium]|nr:hypothetical protein [Candidatus Paceibacterota bacterium]